MAALSVTAAGTNVSAQCILGFVHVIPTRLLGATNGVLQLLSGALIPITQVVGPAGGPISLSQVSGSLAVVCGTLTRSPSSGLQLNVSSVHPVRLG